MRPMLGFLPWGWGATVKLSEMGTREEGLRRKILNSGLLGDVLGGAE